MFGKTIYDNPGLRISWWPFAKCNLNCFYCSTNIQENTIASRGWAIGEAKVAWSRIRDSFGICNVIVSGKECTTEPWLLKILCEAGHFIQASTNLIADPVMLLKAGVDPTKIAFSTSFHPQAWEFEPSRFIKQIYKYQSLGYYISGTTVVGHPAFIEMMPKWIRIFLNHNIYAVIHMFVGEFQGKKYPKNYSDKERSIVNEFVSVPNLVIYGDPMTDTCSAGCKYIHVNYFGDIGRCHLYINNFGKLTGDGGMEIRQNIFHDDINLLDSAKFCALKVSGQCNVLARYWMLPEEVELDYGISKK